MSELMSWWAVPRDNMLSTSVDAAGAHYIYQSPAATAAAACVQFPTPLSVSSLAPTLTPNIDSCQQWQHTPSSVLLPTNASYTNARVTSQYGPHLAVQADDITHGPLQCGALQRLETDSNVVGVVDHLLPQAMQSTTDQ